MWSETLSETSIFRVEREETILERNSGAEELRSWRKSDVVFLCNYVV